MQTLYRAEVKGFFICTQLNQQPLRVAHAAITSQVCAMSVFKISCGKRKREFVKGVMFRTWKPCALAEVQCCVQVHS